MISNIIFLVIGTAAGFAAVWFIYRYKTQAERSFLSENEENLKAEIVQLNSELVIGQEKHQLIKENLDTISKEVKNKEERILSLTQELSIRTTDLKNLQQRLNEQKKDVEDLQNKFRIEFKQLANEILEEKTGKFTKQNKENLDTILKPLQEKIRDFEKKVEETYDKEAQQRFSLKEEVKRLALLNQQVSDEAKNLTRALKGESKTQGNWGELILENILEKSGLAKDREYFVQQSYTDEGGQRFQPDVIVKYPGERNVVVDSKVSLTAYERYIAAEDEVQKKRYLADHLLSIKSHIKGLSEKSYQDLYQLKTLDFVMLFMPIEPAYLLAIQEDAELWNFAYEKRILLISPTNLIAALKMIASMWRQEYQSQNVMEIARQSGALYDKFVGLVENLQDIGKRLDGTKKAHEEAMKKISTGSGNLINRVESIKKLGAKTKKEMPDEFRELGDQDLLTENND